MRVYNITAVGIAQGVRMDLNVMQQRSVFAIAGEEGSESHILCSMQATYKQEIKPGDHVTWEVTVDNWSPSGTIELHPSVTFREMESEHTALKIIEREIRKGAKVAETKKVEEYDDDNDAGTVSVSGDGSFADNTVVDMDDYNMDIVLCGEPVRLSPMVGMQTLSAFLYRWARGH
jgi:hypothetical protein